MLDRPQLADLVIPDLARWEDWSVMDRLVELFKNANDESSWVRVPVVNYLRACPLPKAKEQIDELAKIDPDTVKRANTFFPLAGAPAGSADNALDRLPRRAAEATTPATDCGVRKFRRTDGEGATTRPPSNARDSRHRRPPSGRAAFERRPRDPAPPANNLPVFGGLAAAAVLLACAFWAILKGGQHAAG